MTPFLPTTLARKRPGDSGQGRKEAGRFGSGEERGREIQVRGGKRPGDSGQGRKEAARFRAGDEKGWEIQSRDEMRVCRQGCVIILMTFAAPRLFTGCVKSFLFSSLEVLEIT